MPVGHAKDNFLSHLLKCYQLNEETEENEDKIKAT